MANYYIDYENVHNEGLKGVQKLQQGDRLYLFYSVKADTLKIDVVRQLMECPAEISFDKIINGVENALDFQLITALMCNYTPDEDYYIISRDKGYDAAIEMAGKQNRCNIYRCKEIEGAIKHQDGLGIDESDQEIIVDLGDLSNNELVADSEPTSNIVPEAGEIVSENQVLDDVPAIQDDVNTKSANAEQLEPLEAVQESDDEESATITQEEMERIFSGKQNVEDTQTQETEEQAELQPNEAPVEAVVLSEDEIKRRAHQSICTKILNHVKLIQKIPLIYKQAEYICEALEDSDTKMQFYHRLLQSLGRKKGGELYQKIKAVYKPIRGIYQASLAGDEQSEDNKSSNMAVPSEDVQIATQESSDIVTNDVAPQEKTQRIIKHGRGTRPTRSVLKNPRARRQASDRDTSEPTQEKQVEAVRAAFEQAEQQQGAAGEAILQMVELAKNI